MNISIVEDNDTVREMLTIALSLQGHHISTYKNGFSLLEKLSTMHADLPDVLLVDEMLPGGLSGVETVHHLRMMHPTPLPSVIFITGAGSVRIRHIEESLPEVAVLPKPIRIKALLQLIEAQKPSCL